MRNENYFAKTTNSWRHILLYTPPGYDANLKTRYSAFYLQHGGGEDERVWFRNGPHERDPRQPVGKGKVKPFLVVMETNATGGPESPGGRPGIVGVPAAGGAGRGTAAPPARGAVRSAPPAVPTGS